MGGRTWVHDPHSGGVPIPPAVREQIERRIKVYAEKNHSGKYTSLSIRFKGALCYVDAFTEPDEPSPGELRAFGETRRQYFDRLRGVPTHLCRLRYFGDEGRWTLAFFTYSNERYEACVFRNGTFPGTPEEAFEVGAVYLGA